MLLTNRTTLAQYLIETSRAHPEATGEFNDLVLQIALACKAIARKVAYGALREPLDAVEGGDPKGEAPRRIDMLANEIFLRTTEWAGALSGIASKDVEQPTSVPEGYPRGKYLLVFDSLDGSRDIDLNVAVGSIFSIMRAREPGSAPDEADFLRPGSEQVAAGYAIYGPSTMLVLTAGQGVVGFTLDPELGDFFLTHPDMRVRESSTEFAINASNSRFWEAPVRRYVEECLAGQTGPRGKDFNMRWIASLVAETHRILTRGGVFLYPRDTRDPAEPGRLRLLYKCNPIGMVIEQAGGRASTGEMPVLEVRPTTLHQRVGLVFGSAEEVERIELYHNEPQPAEPDTETPLFNVRGLFSHPA